MGRSKIEIGPASKRAAQNVRRIRRLRELTLEELAKRVTAVGRPMSAATLGQIESSGRRMDVDDFVALADALLVDPMTLLKEIDFLKEVGD